MKKVPIQTGIWVFIILALYLYIGNPLGKNYNLALIALIVSIVSLVISLVLHKFKRKYETIGRLCVLALFCVAYFFL
ncbi:MAG TPA: hypothetical protein DCX97_08080 [Alistipes sp.]|nr:hypothetical protein [Alistipes sp.]